MSLFDVTGNHTLTPSAAAEADTGTGIRIPDADSTVEKASPRATSQYTAGSVDDKAGRATPAETPGESVGMVSTNENQPPLGWGSCLYREPWVWWKLFIHASLASC